MSLSASSPLMDSIQTFLVKWLSTKRNENHSNRMNKN